jgi:hypothetical protein
MYSGIASSSSVGVCSAISLMMSYKKLDDKGTPFLGYRQITIALICPRLLSEIRRHRSGDDLRWIQCDCRTACMPVLEYCRVSFPTVWETTCMRSVLPTYNGPKTFQLRQGGLDVPVGSAEVVTYCNYSYPVRLCQLLEAVKYIFLTYRRW